MFPLALSVELLTIVFEDPVETWNYGNLAAPYWRWYANYSTGASVVISGRETALLPGFAYLIPPETPFSTRLDAPVGHLYVHFIAAEPFASFPPDVYSFKLADGERVARDRLATAFRSRRISGLAVPVSMGDAASLAGAACDAASLALGALGRISDRLPAPRVLDPRIERLVRLMDEARDRAPRNPELAAAAGMHPDAMIRLFRAETGLTPARWSLRRRIDRACVLLSHSDRTIKDIAAACGFTDRDYFTTAFARLRGKPPARWRAEQAGRGSHTADSRSAEGRMADWRTAEERVEPPSAPVSPAMRGVPG